MYVFTILAFMTILENAFVTFAKTIKEHLADFAIAIIVYTILLIILSIPIIVITGQIVPPGDSISSIIMTGLKNMESGSTLAQSLSAQELKTLGLSIAIYFVGTVLFSSFFMGGFINMATNGGTLKERLSIFFSKGFALLPRMITMFLLESAFMLFILLVGALVGVIVSPAAVFFVAISALVMIFFIIRLQLAPFGFALTKKPVMETLVSSYEISAPFFWVIAGLFFLVSITFFAIPGLTGRFIGLTEFFMALETIVTLTLLLPIYTEAINRKMENA